MSETVKAINIDSYRMRYTTHGDPANPPLLLVHGWISHRGVWRRTVEWLQDRYYCITPDLIGFGDSDRAADADYAIPAQARRVLALADHLGLDRFALAGHSMGGQISLTIAGMLAPERVSRLLLVAPVVTGKTGPHGRWVALPQMQLASLFPPMVDLVRWSVMRFEPVARLQFAPFFHNYTHLPFEAWAVDREQALKPGFVQPALRAQEAIQSFYVVPHLPNIQAPTLVMYGMQDGTLPPHEGKLIEMNVPDSRFVLLDDCGHFPMYEQPDTYLEIVNDFFTG